MKKAALYIHGKGGSAAEAERLSKNCPGFDVIGVDYEVGLPWLVEPVIRAAYDRVAGEYGSVSVIANSIGAFYTMRALCGCKIERALFISPILDMERLILNMMSAAGVGEDELREKRNIETDFGETLSWDYLQYVRENPVRWDVFTEILYAGGDNLTSRETADTFVKSHNARLAVMEDGEHWFHTERQLEFLDSWMQNAMK